MYDLLIGQQMMHNLGVVLDFKKKTIQIDKILLPMDVQGTLPICNSNLALPGCLGRIPISPKSELAHAVP
jgi:hypothetical protein